jgi:hypothetical protein
MQRCQPLPDYGLGTGGWRADLAVAGNQRARLGVGAPGSFFSWLLERARLVDPALMVCSLPGVGAV